MSAPVRITRHYSKKRQRWVVTKLSGKKTLQTRICKTEAEAADQELEWKGESIHFSTTFDHLSDGEKHILLLAHERAKEMGLDLYELVLRADQQKAARSGRLEELAREYVKVLEMRQCSAVHVRDVRQLLERFCANYPASGTRSLTTERCREFVYADNTHSPETQRKRLTKFKSFCKWLISRKVLSENPCEGVEPPVRNKHKQVPILTIQEARDLLHTCLAQDQNMIAYFVLSLFGGLRPSEISGYEVGKKPGITWGHVKMRNKDIVVPDECAKVVGRTIPITPNLHEWLKAYPKAHLYPISNFKTRFQTILKASGIDWRQDILRHSYCSYYLAKHRDLGTLAYNIGHVGTLAVLRRHYENRRVKPSQARTYWSLKPEDFTENS